MSGVLIPTASEADWLDRRRRGVTASEIAVILGLSPYSSPFELYYRKTGDLPGQPDNAAMAIGRAMENFVADEFSRRHPDLYLSGSGRELYQHSERDWQMATPDRVAHESYEAWRADLDPLAAVECKVDNGDGFGDEGSDDIPVHYRCQVLWQMDVLGVTTGYLAALIWHRRQVRVYELGHDPGCTGTLACQVCADLHVMRTEAWAFLGRIEDRTPPEPDWRPATTAALKRLHPSLEDREQPVGRQFARSYLAAVRRYREAEQRKDELTNQLRDRIGTARYATSAHGGPRIARRDVFPVKEHMRRASTTDKIVPLKEKTP